MEFKTHRKAIAIEFTEQQLSPHAGSAVFWGWLHQKDWRQRLAAALPHRLPISNNKLLPLEKALAFMHGLLCDARKRTQFNFPKRWRCELPARSERPALGVADQKIPECLHARHRLQLFRIDEVCVERRTLFFAE